MGPLTVYIIQSEGQQSSGVFFSEEQAAKWVYDNTPHGNYNWYWIEQHNVGVPGTCRCGEWKRNLESIFWEDDWRIL